MRGTGGKWRGMEVVRNEVREMVEDRLYIESYRPW